MTNQYKPLKDRFLEKVDLIPFTTCHIWNAYTDKNGYGKISIDHKPQLAHRVAYELFVGNIPQGMLILHSCDNPYCVNPDHLRVGTNAENMRDKGLRGKNFKITNEQATEIKELLKSGVKIKEVARIYNLDYYYVNMVRIGKARKFSQ